MFPKFADVIAAVDDLKERGIVEDYAVFGAIAHAFWDEAIPTFDLDVLVLLPLQPGLIDLAPLDRIYRWAEEKGFQPKAEHILIGDIPVQFVPAPNPLHEEAVKNAATLDFEGSPLRVVRPEYLIATWLQPPANKRSRKERAAKLHESVKIDDDLLNSLLTRFGLSW